MDGRQPLDKTHVRYWTTRWVLLWLSDARLFPECLPSRASWDLKFSLYWQWRTEIDIYMLWEINRRWFPVDIPRFSSWLTPWFGNINNICWYLIVKVNTVFKINNYVIQIWINLLNMVKISSEFDNSLSRTHHDYAQISNSLYLSLALEILRIPSLSQRLVL